MVIGVIKSIIDRVYVTQEGEESKCHLFIKGNKTESYDDFFVCSDTSIDAESQMCDSEEYRKLHPYEIRHSASPEVQSNNESPRTCRTYREGKDHSCI